MPCGSMRSWFAVCGITTCFAVGRREISIVLHQMSLKLFSGVQPYDALCVSVRPLPVSAKRWQLYHRPPSVRLHTARTPIVCDICEHVG